MTGLDEDGGDVTYKLTQKVPTVTGSPGLITTLYLSAGEYAALIGLPADALRKVRSSFPPLGVDAFEGPLSGLILAEAEFDSAADEVSFRPPAQAVAEVTSDARFAGGHLATLSANETTRLLRMFDIGR